MVRRGLVLGCGGTVGGAWQVDALAAVEAELGWDPRTAEVIVGTSAGATCAVLLGAGIGVSELVAAQQGLASARESVRRFFTEPPAALPAFPRGAPLPRLTAAGLRDRSALLAMAGLLPGGRTDPSFLNALVDDLVPEHPAIWLVATAVSSGRRVLFGGPSAPDVALRDAVRASWAIPGWYPPVRAAGDRFVDGGVVSTASADALVGLGLDEAVVVAPMAAVDRAAVPGVGGLLESRLRRPMSRRLDREIRALEAAGTRVLRVHPTAAELAVLGPNFMDPRRRAAALEVALRRRGEGL